MDTPLAPYREYHFAGYRLDLRQRRLLDPENATVALSNRAFDTLAVLLKHAGETLSKHFLMDAVWPAVVVEENNLNQAISSLRKALGDNKQDSRFILTVPGKGYCFVAAVEELTTAPDAPAPNTHLWEPAPAADPDPPGLVRAIRAITTVFTPLGVVVLSLVAGILWLALFGLRESDAPLTTSLATRGPAVLEDTLDLIPDSVAVLPFTNLNPTGENALFALGLHDEVVNQLTKIRSLNVIARNSVLTLVDQKQPLSEIRRLLRVENVMSGTVLFAGTQARVNLQLLDPATGVSFWAGTYEADTSDLGALIDVQSAIALNVATALEAEIHQSEQDLISTLPTDSFEAWRYNLAARNAHYQQDYAMEWNLARQAIDLDPDYMDALFTFSSVNNVLVATPLPGMSSRDHFELALESAERIITLAPESSSGYALKAVALGTSKDWEGVAQAIDTLEAMETPLSELRYIALLLLCLGDFERAISIYEANLITEPLNFYSRGFLMTALELAGRRDAVRREYRLGEELNPVWWGDAVNIFLALGDDTPLVDVDDIVGISDSLKFLLHNVNDDAVVKAGVQAYLTRNDKVSAEALFHAALAAHVGDMDTAVALMHYTVQDVWTALHWFWLPVFDEVRQQEGFRQLLRDSGLVAYWKTHGWPEVCRPVDETFTCDWKAYP